MWTPLDKKNVGKNTTGRRLKIPNKTNVTTAVTPIPDTPVHIKECVMFSRPGTNHREIIDELRRKTTEL